MIEHALKAVENDWYVFPLAPGTKIPPKGTRGLTDATLDTDQIEQWWAKWPDANIGIATGPSGLVVIDIDVAKDQAYWLDDDAPLFGMDAWAAMVNNAGLKSEPRSYEVWTPSGGEHIYWQANPALPIKTLAGALAPGIDVRAVNGSIVAAGSKTDKGTYEAHRSTKPKPLPSWLRKELGRAGLAVSEVEKQARTPAVINISSGDSYATAAFKGELEQLRATPIGAGLRNQALNKAAFKLRKFVDENKLAANEVADALFLTATGDLAMKDNEAIATIRSGLGV